MLHRCPGEDIILDNIMQNVCRCEGDLCPNETFVGNWRVVKLNLKSHSNDNQASGNPSTDEPAIVTDCILSLVTSGYYLHKTCKSFYQLYVLQ
jgi:hypothetical protein